MDLGGLHDGRIERQLSLPDVKAGVADESSKNTNQRECTLGMVQVF